MNSLHWHGRQVTQSRAIGRAMFGNAGLVAEQLARSETIGESSAAFDLVLGRTAFETEYGTLRGGIAPPL